jgi:PAS domain-containing protein
MRSRATGADTLGRNPVDEFGSLVERILDQAGDAIIYADRSGTIRRWNRVAAVLFGFSAEEALGQSPISSSPVPCAPGIGAASTRR